MGMGMGMGMGIGIGPGGLLAHPPHARPQPPVRRVRVLARCHICETVIASVSTGSANVCMSALPSSVCRSGTEARHDGGHDAREPEPGERALLPDADQASRQTTVTFPSASTEHMAPKLGEHGSPEEIATARHAHVGVEAQAAGRGEHVYAPEGTPPSGTSTPGG
jgi:hypothetical protein